jgi:O-antigen/teichoic acid export membrane protein
MQTTQEHSSVEQTHPAVTVGGSHGRRTGLAASICGGTSALAAAVVMERGLGFIANTLAARMAGAGVFGTYSLALTTANSIASYAGAGIGTTSNRFSGECGDHRSLLKSLLGVTSLSVAVAVTGLWLTAGVLGNKLLHNAALVPVLRVAAFSAGAAILAECFRGFLTGQRRYGLLTWFSLLTGCGLLVALPLTAGGGAVWMIRAQAGVFAGTVVICALLFRTRKRTAAMQETAAGPGARAIWRFGMVQLASVAGVNLAGWWVAALVSRADPHMLQMGFYAVSNQMRNMAALMPGLVSQANYGLLTDHRGAEYGGADRVLTYCSLITAIMAVLLSGVALAGLPRILHLLYGGAYTSAELPAALAIVTVIIHIGSAPACSRLTVASLRLTSVVNAVWAISVAGLGLIFIPGRGAVAATAVMLLAHLISSCLSLIALAKVKALASGVAELYQVLVVCALLFVALELGRSRSPNPLFWTLCILVATCIGSGAIVLLAKRQQLLPSAGHLFRRLRPDLSGGGLC